MTQNALLNAIFGGPAVAPEELGAFLRDRGIVFPCIVTTVPEKFTPKPPEVALHLHAGVGYCFKPVRRSSAEVRQSPAYARNSGDAIQAIRQSILALRKRELGEMGRSSAKELSFQAEIQAFHLATQDVRENGVGKSEALGLWIEIVLHRHQKVLNSIRRKMIEFIGHLTRGVDTDLSYPFFHAVQRIFGTYKFTELAAVFRESLQEIVGLVAGRRALHPTDSSGIDPAVQRAFSFMEGHYAEAVGLKEVANASFVSGAHLARLFKRETGRTVVEHLHLLRLTRAKELLATSEKSILEIALESGFPAVEHFHRIFRRTVGLTPRVYRLSFR